MHLSIFGRNKQKLLTGLSSQKLYCPKTKMICIVGMRDGWFTGKKLSDYINNDEVDFYNARRIVNGLVKEVPEKIEELTIMYRAIL